MTVKMWELLAETLGDTPSDYAIWKATRNGKSGKSLALEFLDRYKASELQPLPIKTNNTLRPAYLLDYVGRQATPYDREFEFVGKSLLYAEQVAVVDEFDKWARLDEPEPALAEFDFGGFPDSGNLTWTLRRIAKYAELEEADLLFYVAGPPSPISQTADSGLMEGAIKDLSPLVIERNDWDSSAIHRLRGTGMVEQELELWFRELNRVLRHAEAHSQHLDLYLPRWFAGPELLDWTFREVMPPDWMSSSMVRNQQALTQLFDLPAPSIQVLHSIGLNELLEVRGSDRMSQWREGLRQQLESVEIEPTLLRSMEFREHLQELASQLLLSQRARPSLRGGFNDLIQTGLTVPPAAALMHQDPMAAIVVGGAPILASVASSLFSWLLAATPDDGAGSVRGTKKETSALRLYLNEPATALNSKMNMPPSSWMRTLDGRPVALDFFDWDE